jgi:hypothetical protein
MDRHGELGRRTHKIAIVEPMGEKVTHFQRERQTWQNNRAKIDKETEGIVWLIARFLHWLMWLIPNPIDQNPWAHWRSPMDMMRQS